MVNELLEMLTGGNDERACCDGRDRQGGILGFLARLFGGDDDDGDSHRQGGCCSDATSDGDNRDPDRAGRQRDQRDDDFDFGD